MNRSSIQICSAVVSTCFFLKTPPQCSLRISAISRGDVVMLPSLFFIALIPEGSPGQSLQIFLRMFSLALFFCGGVLGGVFEKKLALVAYHLSRYTDRKFAELPAYDRCVREII